MSRGWRQSTGEAEAFRRAVDTAKDRRNISDVVRRHAKVIRAGPLEHRSLCLFHKERTPSMQLNDAKGTFHCFGCGRSGDIVTLVMAVEGLSFIEAVRWLDAYALPAVDPEQRRKALEEEAALRAAAIARAVRVWEAAAPVTGSPAEAYLRGRGITMPLPPSLRFARTPAWYDDDTGECGPDLPALLGAVTTRGRIIGLQRIFIAPDGSAKARMDKPKRSLGRVKGGALIIRDAGGASSEVIVTEGPEDGLSIAQEMPDAQVWVTLGTAMMPEVDYPPEVRSIVIAGQNDAPGRVAADKALAGLLDRGFDVRTMSPAPGFKDWNDQLRGIRC